MFLDESLQDQRFQGLHKYNESSKKYTIDQHKHDLWKNSNVISVERNFPHIQHFRIMRLTIMEEALDKCKNSIKNQDLKKT